jgi:hypothetical protein
MAPRSNATFCISSRGYWLWSVNRVLTCAINAYRVDGVPWIFEEKPVVSKESYRRRGAPKP